MTVLAVGLKLAAPGIHPTHVLVVVGVATAGVNLFTLFAYASGLRITSSFIIGGTSTVLLLAVGRSSSRSG